MKYTGWCRNDFNVQGAHRPEVRLRGSVLEPEVPPIMTPQPAPVRRPARCGRRRCRLGEPGPAVRQQAGELVAADLEADQLLGRLAQGKPVMRC